VGPSELAPETTGSEAIEALKKMAHLAGFELTASAFGAEELKPNPN